MQEINTSQLLLLLQDIYNKLDNKNDNTVAGREAGDAVVLKAGAGIVIKNNIISVTNDILNLTEIKQFIAIEPYGNNKFIDNNGLQYTLNNGIATIFKNPFDINGEEPIPTYENLNGSIQIFPYVKYGETIYNVKFPNDCSGMFALSNAYEFEVISPIDMSNVENMNFMFAGAFNRLYNLDLRNFVNTIKLYNMNYMFIGNDDRYNLRKTINIYNFDTSKVESMIELFVYNTKLELFIVGPKFNTSNTKDITGMFTTVPINTFNYNIMDVSNVNNMKDLFNEAFKDNINYYEIDTIDITSWNTSKATNMSYMFDCDNISYIELGSNFFINENTDVTNMFRVKELQFVYIPKKYDKLFEVLNTQSNGAKWKDYDESSKRYEKII